MKRIQAASLLLCCLLGCSAMAEHQTYLRGIVSLPDMQVALVQIDHTIANPGAGAAGLHTITTLRPLHVGEKFEDRTIKGAHFQFEVMDIDFSGEIVKTREDGVEHQYSIPFLGRPKAPASSIHLQNFRFNEVLDLYSKFTGRTILIHPGVVDRSPVSLEVAWTNKVPDQTEIAEVFAKFIKQRDAVSLEDGERFLQIVPTSMAAAMSLRSAELPAARAEWGCSFSGVMVKQLVDSYDDLSGRHTKDKDGALAAARSIPYFNTVQMLSKPQGLYAVETMLLWYGFVIRFDPDGTYRLTPVSRQPKT